MKSDSRSTLEGSIAPQFFLPDHEGKWMTLEDFTKDGPVMLVFYPGDFTMVCTKQLCSYEDTLEEFKKYGVQVVGISANYPEEHTRFRTEYKFSFPLLTDVNRAVTKSYGVTSLFMMGGTSRAVFLIAKDSKILYRYVEPTTITFRRPTELLEKLRVLREAGKI